MADVSITITFDEIYVQRIARGMFPNEYDINAPPSQAFALVGIEKGVKDYMTTAFYRGDKLFYADGYTDPTDPLP